MQGKETNDFNKIIHKQDKAINNLTVAISTLTDKLTSFSKDFEKLNSFINDPEMIIALKTIKNHREDIARLINDSQDKRRIVRNIIDKIIMFVAGGVLVWFAEILMKYLEKK